MNHPPLNRQRIAGLTLVEILITLLVISIGLLGVAGLHAMSLRNNYDALMRSHASALAGDMIDRMRANRAAVTDGGDYDEIVVGTDVVIEKDSPQATIDVAEWQATLKAQLPEGTGAITIDAAGIVRIEVQWGERGDTMSFITETEI